MEERQQGFPCSAGGYDEAIRAAQHEAELEAALDDLEHEVSIAGQAPPRLAPDAGDRP